MLSKFKMFSLGFQSYTNGSYFTCRAPIPDRYFIIVRGFRNRHTMAYRTPCSSKEAKTCGSGWGDLAKLRRSLNRQCSRNVSYFGSYLTFNVNLRFSTFVDQFV